MARALLALGVQHGDRVAVVMEKGWQQIAAVHGILRLGAVYLPVDPVLPPRGRHAARPALTGRGPHDPPPSTVGDRSIHG
nr:AMP-binding protein [Klebsiella aerogenes]